jgi:hypothetical protein
MPRYKFHVENGEPLSANEWEELPNDDAARAEAEMIAKDLSNSLTSENHRRIIVTNETGEQIAEVPLPWEGLKPSN